MSSPYVYNPSTALQFSNQYQQTPYYYHTPRSTTPFIPDTSLYPPSPYSNPNSLPGTPHSRSAGLPGSPNNIAFPSSVYSVNYAPAWDPPINRERRPSWPGVVDQGFLQAPVMPGYNRRHSFGNNGYQPPYGGIPFDPYYSQPQFHINPWLNAESPRGDFFFDLSVAAFTPLRLYGPGQSTLLAGEEMNQPATHPPLTRLRIVCDLIPQWPIDLEYNPYGVSTPLSPGVPYQPPPITLADVLVAIHRAMHQRISQIDWVRLNKTQETEIARAYTKRCRAVPSMVEHELAQGVKRVDFLLGKTRMVGLVRGGEGDGGELMRLIVADR